MLEIQKGVSVRSGKGAHDCKECVYSKDSYCTKFSKWGFKVGKECKK